MSTDRRECNLIVWEQPRRGRMLPEHGNLFGKGPCELVEPVCQWSIIKDVGKVYTPPQNIGYPFKSERRITDFLSCRWHLPLLQLFQRTDIGKLAREWCERVEAPRQCK